MADRARKEADERRQRIDPEQDQPRNRPGNAAEEARDRPGAEASRDGGNPDGGGEDALGEVQQAEEGMRQLEQERDELFGRLQRVSADYQNYMRRAETKLAEAIELAQGDLLKRFIPILDEFERALETEPTSEDGKRLHEGVRMVREELLKVLQQQGVERVEPSVGEPFDPHLHEAMMRQPGEGVEPNHISASFAPGYVYKGGRTLRPAKVAVAPEE